MSEATTKRGIRGAGIVLGLYLAALLLSGPLHFLMHPAAAAPCAEGAGQTAAFETIQPGKTIYSLHHCPACFLHSSSVAGEQSSSYETVAATGGGLITAASDPAVNSHNHIPLRDRAPPFVL